MGKLLPFSGYTIDYLIPKLLWITFTSGYTLDSPVEKSAKPYEQSICSTLTEFGGYSVDYLWLHL